MRLKKILSIENIINISSVILLSSISVYAFIYLFFSDSYIIENIEISGNNYLDSNNVALLIKDNIKNKNIYNIRIKELNKKIMAHAFIQTSKIYTTLPNTISIVIDEINPILLFHKDKEYYLIDDRYSQIKADTKSINHYSIPIIFDYDRFDNQYIEIVNSLNYIIDNNIKIYNDINEVKVNDDEILYMIKNNSTIKLSIENIRKNTIKLIEFDKQLNHENSIVLYKHIDLSVPNQIIVKEKTI